MNILPLHFKDLFAQLGLADDNESIRRFIDDHGPLDCSISLAEASFWSETQSAFLVEQILADADWVALVDQLNSALRSNNPSIGGIGSFDQ